MAIQPAICSNCGGALQVDDVDLNGFCECKFCHTSHKVIDIITVDGIPTLKGLLENANIAMNDNNGEKAMSFFDEALKIKPNCHEAWWGKYICQSYFDEYYGYEDKYGNRGPITQASIMLNTINKYAERAIQYAPPEQAKLYQQMLSDKLSFIEQVRNGVQDKSNNGKKGCYIATAVYGSYTCDEVMALRRYRDDYLSNRLLGRAFIKVYYFISPSLVRFIKKGSVIEKYIKNYLDNKVKSLSEQI